MGLGRIHKSFNLLQPKREKFSFETDRQTERQVHLLTCSFAAKIAHLTTGTVVVSKVPPTWAFICRVVLGVFLID